MAKQPGVLTEREAIRALSADIPSLWGSSTTKTVDRQMIIRQLIEQIVCTVEGKPETFDFLGFTHICGQNSAVGCNCDAGPWPIDSERNSEK